MKSKVAWRLRFLLGRLPKRRPRRARKGRVLCLLRGGLGDKLMALPAVRSFREEFHGSALTLVVEGIVPPFFAAETDRLITIPTTQPWKKFPNAARGFDACFVNSIGVFDIWSEVAAALTGAADLRGPRPRDLTDTQSVYTRPFAFGGAHETAVNLRGAGGNLTGLTTPYYLRLDGCPRDPTMANAVVIHPGSSAFSLVNRWSPTHFASLARMFAQRGIRTIAVGTPDEAEYLQRLRIESDDAIELRLGLALEEIAKLLASAALVIANDSGIGHLAAAVGARLITIMGANRPELVAPVGARVSIIGPRCPKGGCYGTVSTRDCLRCIDRIAPEEVFSVATLENKSFACS